MMETREITVTIHREPEKRDDLLATLLIVVLAALAFTAGYIAANAQWRETISEMTPEPPVVAQETRAKLLMSYEEPTESITTSRYAEVSQEDCELIAKIVYLEARGEPLEGQQAVAEVILNRVAADNFPDSVEEVIFQGTDGSGAIQFSTAAHLDEAAPTDKQFAAVGQALYGEPVLPMDVVFFSTTGENSRTWGAIGGHIFCYYALRILSRTGNDAAGLLAVILGFFGGELLFLCLRTVLKERTTRKDAAASGKETDDGNSL